LITLNDIFKVDKRGDRALVYIIIPHWCLGKKFCKSEESLLPKNTAKEEKTIYEAGSTAW
jgi:hypothetical protein